IPEAGPETLVEGNLWEQWIWDWYAPWDSVLSANAGTVLDLNLLSSTAGFGAYVGNEDFYTALGGGVHCASNSDVLFQGCVIRGNRTYGSFTGIGGVPDGEPRNIEPLYEFEISTFGAGVYCAPNSRVRFESCTFEDNLASNTVDDPNAPVDINAGANADIFVAGADATTRGGNLIIDTADDVATNISGSTITIDADMLLTTLTIKSGDGGSAGVGNAMTTTLGNAAGDAIDVTGLVVTGGAAALGVAGGANTVTVTGTLAVGSGGIDINAGAGGSTAVGGAVTVNVAEAVTSLTGAVTIDGGLGGSNSGLGGAAKLDFAGALTSVGNTYTITSGNGGSGAGNGGAAELEVGGAFVATTSTVAVTAGTGGGTNASDGGIATGDFDSTISVQGMTVTGGKGSASAVTGDGGAAILTVVGAATIGSSGFTVKSGDGGDGAAAALGGDATATLDSTSTITGAVAVTGGVGGSGDAGGAAGTALLTFTDDVTATAQTLTITGGAGDATVASVGGTATAEFVASATFTSIVLDDGTDGAGTGGSAILLINTVDGQGETITGAITAAADGEGTITVEGDTNQTFASAIGTSSIKIGTLNVGNANDSGLATFNENVFVTNIVTDDASAANTMTFLKDVTTTSITLDDTGSGSTMNLSGTIAQTIAGTIDGVAADDGLVDVVNTSGTVTFSGKLGNSFQLKEVEISASATAVFEDTVDSVLIDLDGTVTFEVDGNVGDTVDFADNSTLTLGSGVVAGETLFTTVAGITNATAGTVTLNLPANFSTGTITLFSANAVNADADQFVNPDTGLVNYTVATAGGVTTVVASKNSAATIASILGTTTDAANALDNGVTAAANDAEALDAYTTALNAGGADATLAAEQSQPSPAALTA
ncbi:MAG: hypothetical protein IIA44_09935, partial [Acidobacteria bacterium]|nr:hypothetical protein [Acidobacteriota bacterium]